MDEMLWFLDGLARVRLATTSGRDGISVIEQAARCGDSPPLHVHEREDELFHVVEGELAFTCGDRQETVVAGNFFLVPKGVLHSFVVTSTEARWFVTTVRGDYERFIRAMSIESTQPGWPPPQAATEERIAHISEVAADHHIRIVGPPLGRPLP